MVGIGTCYGLGGAEFDSCWGPGLFLSVKPVRAGPRAKLVSLKTYLIFPEGQSNGGIVLNILTHLAPRVGQSQNYTAFPCLVTGRTLPLSCHMVFCRLHHLRFRYTLKQQTINEKRHVHFNYDY